MRPSIRVVITFSALLTGAVACGEQSATTAPRAVVSADVAFAKQQGHNGNDDKHEKIAECKQQKERFYSVVVGENGAVLEQGENSLVIPAGALPQPTRIGIHVLPTTHVRVEFSPEGLQFAVPATLTLSYASCQTPLLGRVSIAYLKADTINEIVPSRDHVLKQKVSAPINHFSSYAVAY